MANEKSYVRGWGWISSISREQAVYFQLLETPKGYVMTKNGTRFVQISKSTRNWMQAERKFKNILILETKKFIRRHPGKFKEIYSNLFSTPNSDYFTQKEMERMYTDK